jgi:chitodextrinase
VVVAGDGQSLTYKPNPDYCNSGAPTDDFSYTLNGGSQATVAVRVDCADDPPTAVNDSAAMPEDAAASPIDVLANDTDPDGGPKQIAAAAQPVHGTVVVAGDGQSLTYKPNPDYCNSGAPTDDFSYTLNGGSQATVAVRVNCVYDPPTTLNLKPAADARVQEANPTTNYGTSFLRADGGSDPDVESYLRFDVAGPAGRTLQSAKLRLFTTSDGTVNGPAAYSSDNAWSETGITWANRRPRTSGPTDDKAAIKANSWVEYNVKPLVSGNGTYSFILATTSNDGVDFLSRETGNATLRPELVVTFVDTDVQRPSAPSGLTAQAATSTRVDLSWTAATDDAGVTGYRIYRNGSLLSTVGAVTSYADTTVAPGTSYAYRVTALDQAGNESAPSNTATVTTPTTLTFNPAADARVQEANPTTNYGTSYLRADGGSDPDVESYLRFNVAGPAGATLQSAKLRLFATSGTVNGPAAYSSDNAWTETGITWQNRRPRTSGPTDDKAAIKANSWVEYNVKPLVSGNGTYSFILATTSNDGIDFVSRESTTVAARPQLVVTFGG